MSVGIYLLVIIFTNIYFFLFLFKIQLSQMEAIFTPNKTNYRLWSFHNKYYMKI